MARAAAAGGAVAGVLVALFLVSCIQINTGGDGGSTGSRSGLGGASGDATRPDGSAGEAGTETVTGSAAGAMDATAKRAYPLRILTQSRANPVRAAVLDAIRKDSRMGAERGTRFVVRWLAVQNPWAMFQGETEGRDTPVEALLKNVDGRWVVLDLQKTNGRKITWARYPRVPRGVFGPASFSLAPRDPLLVLTNARGDSRRTAILDALRDELGPPPPTFVVRWLRVKSGYAYFMGDMAQYRMPIDAILIKRSWGWDVLEIQGEGDFPVSIPAKYSGRAPRVIFP